VEIQLSWWTDVGQGNVVYHSDALIRAVGDVVFGVVNPNDPDPDDPSIGAVELQQNQEDRVKQTVVSSVFMDSGFQRQLMTLVLYVVGKCPGWWPIRNLDIAVPLEGERFRTVTYEQCPVI
jgi:hypothetical protein